jgi:putative ABC transport system permease protein
MLVLYGTLFAILIACLGLYGLSSMELTKRTKEIGIRKVVGTSVMQILIKISSEFIRLIGISFAIACPVSYLVMDKVLQSVAYRTSLSWWIFALAGLLSILILLTTIIGQTLRAATRNPVEALRYE